MNIREKLSAALVLPGMLLLCADQLPAAVAGVALLGAGAVLLNWAEIRAKLRKIGSQRPRGAQYIARQPKPDARLCGRVVIGSADTAQKSPARAGTRTRQSKKDTPTFYPKKSKKSRHRTTV